MKTFRHDEIKRLAHELTMSPARHRLRQVEGIARVIDLIEPDRDYPYSLVCYHVTGYRPRRGADALLDGKSLKADLVDLCDVLTAEAPLPAAAARGRLYESDALARRFSVSTKTISRWRQRGLAGCWFTDGDGRPTFAFDGRSVERFVARNLELVRRGSSFAVMNDAERARIVERARELVAAEKCSLHAATVRIAEETGRAVETIRYTLRRFDRDHPDRSLFDGREAAKPLDEALVVLEAFDAGATVAQLSKRFNRRAGEVRKMLARGRALRLAESPINYIAHPSFDAPDAEARIAREPAPRAAKRDNDPDETLSRPPADLPPYLRELYRTPLLSREEEARLFREMNFRLHRAETLRRRIAADVDAATDRDMAAVEAALEAALAIKNRLIQANLRLVVSIAKRHVHAHPSLSLFELISDGNLSLYRAVEKFDFARGFRFSTYATWAITRGFARSVPEEITHHGRFQTGCDEVFAIRGGTCEAAVPDEDEAGRIRAAVSEGLAALDEREQTVVRRHFGLAGEDSANQTLEQIGRVMGLSKERVRQIEIRAMAKLRKALAPRGAALLAG